MSAVSVRRPWCWGAGSEELPTLLATLLQFHGVPQTVSKQRAKLVMQSLGKDQVRTALEGVSPWKSLKQLANLHKPVIQLVMPDELAMVVQDRKKKPATKDKQPPKTSSLARDKCQPSQLTLIQAGYNLSRIRSVQHLMS